MFIDITNLKISVLSLRKIKTHWEAACARQANATTGVLFTATNAVKIPSSVTWSSWALLLSYYRACKFLP